MINPVAWVPKISLVGTEEIVSERLRKATVLRKSTVLSARYEREGEPNETKFQSHSVAPAVVSDGSGRRFARYTAATNEGGSSTFQFFLQFFARVRSQSVRQEMDPGSHRYVWFRYCSERTFPRPRSSVCHQHAHRIHGQRSQL